MSGHADAGTKSLVVREWPPRTPTTGRRKGWLVVLQLAAEHLPSNSKEQILAPIPMRMS